MNALKKITNCRECGGDSLTWQAVSTNKTGIAEGRLCTQDVGCTFVLGCDDCSETLALLSADHIASILPAGQSAYQFQTGAYEVELGPERWAKVHAVFDSHNQSESMGCECPVEPDEFRCEGSDLNGLVSEILIELDLARPE